MKLDKDRIVLNVGRNHAGELADATISWTILNPTTGATNGGSMPITHAQYAAIESGEMTVLELTELRIIEELGINATDDDTARLVAVESALKESDAQILRVAKSVEDVEGRSVQAAEIAASKTAHRALDDIRAAVRTMVRISDVPAEQLDAIKALYDPWEADKQYLFPAIVLHAGELYALIEGKNHVSQTDWTPDVAASLWNKVQPKETEDGTEIIPEWKQPTGAHDAYKLGDKVFFDGTIYRSKIDNNAYSPADYPDGWEEVTDGNA